MRSVLCQGFQHPASAVAPRGHRRDEEAEASCRALYEGRRLLRNISFPAALLIIVTAGGGPAYAQETSAPSSWQISESTQALTGTRAITATLLSNEPLSNMIGQSDRAALILRCQDTVLATYIAWPQVLAMNGSTFGGRPQTMILWRTDDQPIAVNFWLRSDSGTATGMFDTKSAAKLMEKLIVAKRLAVRLTGSITQDASFDLSEVQAVASRVGAACGVKWTMKP